MKYVIFGAGKAIDDIITEYKNDTLVGIIDNNQALWANGFLHGYSTLGGGIIHPPLILDKLSFDFVILAMREKYYPLQQLLSMGISPKKILCAKSRSDIIDNETITSDGLLKIHLKNGINMFCRSFKDIPIARGIFFRQLYTFHSSKEFTIIDMGMNIGMSALYFAGLDHVRKVYGFEPFHQTFDYALKNFAINDSKITKKIIPQNYGLGLGERKISCKFYEYFLGNNTTEESLSDDQFDISKDEVLIKDAGAVVDKIITESETSILLKINVEGAENVIFESLLKRNLFEKIDYIMMETHLGSERYITEILTETNYFVIQTNPNNSVNSRYLYAVRKN